VSEGCPPPYSEFNEESMGSPLYRNLMLCNYTKPTPVQKYSIPIGLMEKDMMACAQTGSGMYICVHVLTSPFVIFIVLCVILYCAVVVHKDFILFGVFVRQRILRIFFYLL
jgi:hypothetical protein